MLTALINLLELPEQEDHEDDGFIDVETPAGYQNVFSKLSVCVV